MIVTVKNKLPRVPVQWNQDKAAVQWGTPLAQFVACAPCVEAVSSQEFKSGPFSACQKV